MIIDQPGAYDLSREDYDADPTPAPALSCSVAKAILDQSPAHARMLHPRLNPELERDDESKFDLGRVAHALMLDDTGARVAIIEADDWRTKAAKEARAAAVDEGKVPVLAHQIETVQRMVRAARTQLAAHEASDAFTDGKPEQTLIWQERGTTWCKARLDWLPTQRRGRPFIVYDYKTTGASAHPDAWVRTLYGMSGDLQAAFYRRGVREVLGISNVLIRFVVQEIEPPFALSVIQLDPASMDLAERKVEEAIRAWGHALSSGQWHGYPARVAHVSAPAYEETRWLAREERDQHATPEMYSLAMQMQAPINLPGKRS